MQSNVGNSQVYNDGDQREHKDQGPAPLEAGQRNAHDIHDLTDSRSLNNRAKQEAKTERDADRAAEAKTVTNPLAPAERQGHEPSRGAQVDAELQREEEELLKKKGGFKGMS